MIGIIAARTGLGLPIALASVIYLTGAAILLVAILFFLRKDSAALRVS